MSDFKAEMHQIQIQTPLGELTALPQTSWLDLSGPTSKGGEGREREGRGRKGRKGEKREGKGGER